MLILLPDLWKLETWKQQSNKFIKSNSYREDNMCTEYQFYDNGRDINIPYELRSYNDIIVYTNNESITLNIEGVIITMQKLTKWMFHESYLIRIYDINKCPCKKFNGKDYEITQNKYIRWEESDMLQITYIMCDDDIELFSNMLDN